MRPHKQMHTLAALVNVIVGMVLESLNTLFQQPLSAIIPQNKPLLLIVFLLENSRRLLFVIYRGANSLNLGCLWNVQSLKTERKTMKEEIKINEGSSQIY